APALLPGRAAMLPSSLLEHWSAKTFCAAANSVTTFFDCSPILSPCELFQMLVEPTDNAIQTIYQMLLFFYPVTLARVDDQLGFYSIAFQCAIESLALAERIDYIGIALQN